MIPNRVDLSENQPEKTIIKVVTVYFSTLNPGRFCNDHKSIEVIFDWIIAMAFPH